MKKILEKLRIKILVKVIICIVAISACVGCNETLEIRQEIDYNTFSGDSYNVTTYIYSTDNVCSYDEIMHRQSDDCNIKNLDSLKSKQLIRAEQIKKQLEPLVKH